ncbi:molybdate ABC transporter substrate-binding protein [Alteromonas sp. 1_MG-2023]|uniref:molybdate ABC transporter substrate-binding protein n=1 Tax=Alteromonas sp. 1_MG-2023 TaxID=3062669 RepID=UPI0026E3B15B|nr:molybdate ABC transporter substrate-binding protein [Alteromonas sp. 1_MG-2023]
MFAFNRLREQASEKASRPEINHSVIGTSDYKRACTSACTSAYTSTRVNVPTNSHTSPHSIAHAITYIGKNAGKLLGRNGILMVHVLCFLSLWLFCNVAESKSVFDPNKQPVSNSEAVPLLTSPLQVAVAANFAKPLREIAKEYYVRSGQEVSVAVSSSGTLFAQLTHGAQFDVFLSADTARPNALIQAGRVSAEDVHTYAKGRLAFVSSTSKALTPYFSADSLAGKKLAIANPKLAPYGEAAKQYLTNTEQWNNVAPHLVMGKNVLQTYQFFTTGNADYALVAYSLTVNPELDRELNRELNSELNSEPSAPITRSPTTHLQKNSKAVVLIPDNLHQPILQSLAVTAALDRKAAATAFADYLLSSAVQTSLPLWGYQPVDDSLHADVSANNHEQGIAKADKYSIGSKRESESVIAAVHGSVQSSIQSKAQTSAQSNVQTSTQTSAQSSVVRGLH